jgi:hypothetical protein
MFVRYMEIQTTMTFMKKKYLLGISAALLLVTSCSPKHHYGCRGRRCVSVEKVPVKAPESIKQNA